ncbi:MAG TPA: hypothetical protein VFL07_05935 [Rudaea sp.]|nr:hypothetical protein [Rudaea sp.]
MLSARKNSIAVQKSNAHEHADSGISRFGFIHHRLAWQCRLDATGDSWLRLAHEHKARSLIPADRIAEILAAPDDAAAIADIVIAEFLRRACRHLPHELVAHVRGFTIAWVRDAQRLLRRQQRWRAAEKQDVVARHGGPQ